MFGEIPSEVSFALYLRNQTRGSYFIMASNTLNIKIKNLHNSQIDLEVTPSMLVSELKNLIFEKNSEFTVESQKLIYTGKVLRDNQTLEEYGKSNHYANHC